MHDVDCVRLCERINAGLTQCGSEAKQQLHPECLLAVSSVAEDGETLRTTRLPEPAPSDNARVPSSSPSCPGEGTSGLL